MQAVSVDCSCDVRQGCEIVTEKEEEQEGEKEEGMRLEEDFNQ